MAEPGADLLLTLAVDFMGDPADGSRFAALGGRMAATMALGRAGDVRHGLAGGAWLAARGEQPLPGGRTPRVLPASWHPGPDGAYTLLAGRLFERDALRALLDAPAGCDDAALYGLAHARFGDTCDSRVLGDYAAVQWFPQTRRVRLARSPVSNHPLHVWRDGAHLVVSSTPRAIFAAGVESRIDDTRLTDALMLNMQDGGGSFYAGLSRVATGTVAVHDPGGAALREYWSIASVPEVRFTRDEDYVEAVDEQFRRALRAHLDGVRKPALFLSGGLDSQAVASYAAELLEDGRRLHAFTSVPMPGWVPATAPGDFGDESEHVRALAEIYPRIEANFVDAADVRYGQYLPQMHLLAAWPVFNEMNMHWLHEGTARAAAEGCDVMFTGLFGNVGFSYDGVTGFPTWLRQGKWGRLVREIRCLKGRRPFHRKLLSLAVMPHVPPEWRAWRDRNKRRRDPPFETWCALREDHARADGALERAFDAADDPYFYEKRSSREWRDNVFRSGFAGGPETTLGLQLLHGLRMADPTAFLPLLELCAGIPDEQFLRDGESRWLARRLLQGRVPEMVRTERRKGHQVEDWPVRFLRDRDDLLADLAAMRRDERLARIFDFDRMARNLREWDGTDVSGRRDILRIAMCVGRGISHARFVRYAEGRNAG